MTGLKIFIMVFFLFCVSAANNGGGILALMEFFSVTDMDDNTVIENYLLLLTIGAQIAGIIAILRLNDALMLAAVIALSLVVIVVTIASAQKINKVILPNGLFLLST